MIRTSCFVWVLILGVFGIAQAEPVIKISEPSWNVGIVVSGKTYEKTVVVENVGDKPLVISKVEECCGFYGTLPPGLRLAPGEKTELRLSLAPFKMVGTLHAELLLHSNDPARPKAAVVVEGEVVPPMHTIVELAAREINLGRIGMNERVPFAVMLRNVGNLPLEILEVNKSDGVIEKGTRPVILPGGEGTLLFEYVASKSGEIGATVTISTNDTLDRNQEARLRGHVVAECVTDKMISISPSGGVVTYDVMTKSYHFDFTLSNRGPVQIEIPMLDSSIPGSTVAIDRVMPPGQSAKGSVVFPGGASAAPNSGWIYLQLAIPVELR